MARIGRRSVSFVELLWLLLFATLALRQVGSFDTFWQLQSGKYIVQNGNFIYSDTFSQAKDVFRLEHCWLHDVFLYGLFWVGNYSALVLLKSSFVVAYAIILYRWSERQKVAIGCILPLVTLCLLASQPSWLLRPQLWTFLFSLLFLWVLQEGKTKEWRYSLWLVPMMLLWANLHAACVFGLVLVALFAVGELVRALITRDSFGYFYRLCVVFFGVFAVSFVNPYGYRIPVGVLLEHLDQTAVATGEASVTMLGNMEWLPPSFWQVPLFYVVMSVWLLLIVTRFRRIEPVEVILFVAFCYMGLSQIRHTTLVSLLAGMYLPRALHEVVPSAWTMKPICRCLSRVVVAGVFVSLLVMVGMDSFKGVLGMGLKPGRYPVEATKFLVENKLPGNIFNSYDWGGYLMWELFPDYLVFSDGRATSEEFFHAQLLVSNAGSGWEEKLSEHNVNTIITRTCYFDSGEGLRLIDALVFSPSWGLVYRDDEAVVFVRKTKALRPFWEKELPKAYAYETMLAEGARLYADDNSRIMALLTQAKASLGLGRLDDASRYYDSYLAKKSDDKGTSAILDYYLRQKGVSSNRKGKP